MGRKRKLGGLLFAAAAAGVAGCSVGKDLEAADRAIAVFHAQLDQGQFAEIYAASAPDMKAAGSEAELAKLLQAVHAKLGRFKGGKNAGWNDSTNTSGHYVTIVYAATYERGAAMENFVYRLNGGRAALAGYHISSNALITG